jgi:hypothetical protein
MRGIKGRGLEVFLTIAGFHLGTLVGLEAVNESTESLN